MVIYHIDIILNLRIKKLDYHGYDGNWKDD